MYVCCTLANVVTTTGRTSITESPTFQDFAAYFCPDRKHAWLYKVDEPEHRVVDNRQMDVAPTEDEVNKWVVDFLNGRLNEELAKLIAT